MLTREQKETLQRYGENFKKWIESSKGGEEIKDHRQHEQYFKQKLSQKNLEVLSETEFAEIWKKTWASRMWTNKDWYVKNKLIGTSGIEKIKIGLIDLLYGSEDFVSRYDNFRDKVQGFGVALISEFLNMVFPDKFSCWNLTHRKVIPFLGISLIPDNLLKYSNLSGGEYQQCIDYLNSIRNELVSYGVKDFIDLDLFFWYILEYVMPNDDEKDSVVTLSKSRVWIARAGGRESRGDAENEALENNYITIGWYYPILSQIKEKNELIEYIRKSESSDGEKISRQGISQNWIFINEIKKGDIVLIPLISKSTQFVAIGVVTGDYEIKGIEPHVKQIRNVQWLKKDIPINEFNDIAKKFKYLPRTTYQIDNIDAINCIKEVMRKYKIDKDIEFEESFDVAPLGQNPQMVYTIETISKAIFIDEQKLRTIQQLLEEKKQIIFYGPPGTSKTFVAKKFANYFTSNPGNVEIIQFHPSYSYEDFIEGIKPSLTEEGEAIGFVKQPGIFKNMVDKCIQNPDSRFVLIIDEINRGNISKVFGELIYLLEYRNDKIHLTYSPKEEFYIPENLYIIGTMNSADRSIAFVDYALRRRFYFVDFYPDEEVMKKWFYRNGVRDSYQTKVLGLMKDVNNEISNKLGKEYQIGYSYFMKNLDDEKLKRIIDYAIIPLIEQYFFGKKENVDLIRDICNSHLNGFTTTNNKAEEKDSIDSKGLP